MSAPLLELRDVRKHFRVGPRGFRSQGARLLKAVDGVSLRIEAGQTLGLVGESGCGKTTVGRLLLLLEELTAGDVIFEGRRAVEFTREDLRHFRRAVQPVFQNPFSSLDPRMRVAGIIAEPLTATGSADRSTVERRVHEVLEMVGLRATDANRFPHEFSGGQRQRIAIARALASQPRLIVLDEAVSSQDISIRAQILNLLKDLQARLGMSYLFIAHDLATVRYMCDRIGVMYLGRIVETAGSDELCDRPLHPYTQALFAACLPDDPDASQGRVSLQGEVPSPIDPPPGCPFHTRCPQARPVCSQHAQALREQSAGHAVACVLYDDQTVRNPRE